MHRPISRVAAFGVAAPILIGCAALGAAPTAGAAPYITDDRHTDCSGPTLCTIYWSKSKTADLYSQMNSVAWYSIRATVIAAEVKSSLGGNNRSSVTLDNIEDAAGTAVTYDGCLQYATRKDGQGKGQWSYTTHPDYCWDPADFEF
ncbi:hypothetical protein [Rhodococcoides kroppenstedtii]|uniref:hypothetical protein n=1 Tax=Rhodococcoides kroppenstedtii TaxID=293050 RepID=UPI003624E978